jgi:hypothetical protein
VKEMIGCLPWRFQKFGPQNVAVVKRVCEDCGEEVALSAANVEAASDMRILCIACIMRHCPNLAKNAGGLVNGQKIADLETAVRAAHAVVNRN